jgi:mRNA-degrading endonuclease RelE of RelBE toxin-antitoxin system
VHRVELASRAKRDLKRIKGSALDAILDALEHVLTADPPPTNIDVKPLAGRAPWLRLRVGGHRVLYRPLTVTELRDLDAEEQTGFLVGRVIDRRDLEKAVKSL